MQQNCLYNRLPILGALNGLGYLALALAGLPPFSTKFLLSETGWLHNFFLDQRWPVLTSVWESSMKNSR